MEKNTTNLTSRPTSTKPLPASPKTVATTTQNSSVKHVVNPESKTVASTANVAASVPTQSVTSKPAISQSNQSSKPQTPPVQNLNNKPIEAAVKTNLNNNQINPVKTTAPLSPIKNEPYASNNKANSTLVEAKSEIKQDSNENSKNSSIPENKTSNNGENSKITIISLDEGKKGKKKKEKVDKSSHKQKEGFSFINFILCLFIIITFAWVMLCSVLLIDIWASKDINILGHSIIYSNNDNLAPKIPDGSLCLYSKDTKNIKNGDVIIYFNDENIYNMGMVAASDDINYFIVGKNDSTIIIKKDKVDGVYVTRLETIQSFVEFISVKRNAIICTSIPLALVFVTELIIIIHSQVQKKKIKKDQTDSNSSNSPKSEEMPKTASQVNIQNNVANYEKLDNTTVPKIVEQEKKPESVSVKDSNVELKSAIPSATKSAMAAQKPTSNSTANTAAKPSSNGNVTIKLGANAGPSTITVKQGSASKPGAVTIQLNSGKKQTQPVAGAVKTSTPTANPVVNSNNAPKTVSSNQTAIRPNQTQIKPVPPKNGQK